MATIPDDGTCVHGGPPVGEVPPTLAHLILHFAAAGNKNMETETKNTLPECLAIAKEHPEVACPAAVKLLIQFAITSFLQAKLRLAKAQFCKAKFLEICISRGAEEVVKSLGSKQKTTAPLTMELLMELQKASTDDKLLEALQIAAPCKCLENVRLQIMPDDSGVSNADFLKKHLPAAAADVSAKPI